MSKKPKPQHVPMNQFSVENNMLLVGGVPLDKLALQVGQTPFYAYDRQLITDRVKYLRDSLPHDIHLHYAIKANPMPAVVQHFATLVDGFDLASAGEMKVALDTTMAREHISFAGPGKTNRELRQAIAADVVVNMESESEMRRISVIADELGITPKVAIRVNPDYDLKGSGMKMGGGPKQFGVDAERIPAMLKELSTLQLSFHGFHIFWGSQNLNTDAIMEAHEKTFELAIKLHEHAPQSAKLLNIGGGLGIPYFPGEKRLDLTPIGENLDKLLPNLKANLPDAEIVTELGRYMVGEAGIYVSQVIDIKESRGEKYVISDGGLHHHLAVSGNFGQVIRKNYPVAIGNKIKGETENLNVVGPLCTPLDVLANKMELSKVDIGDYIVIYQSGAYGYTASPHNFLGHPEPVEILV